MLRWSCAIQLILSSFYHFGFQGKKTRRKGNEKEIFSIFLSLSLALLFRYIHARVPVQMHTQQSAMFPKLIVRLKIRIYYRSISETNQQNDSTCDVKNLSFVSHFLGIRKLFRTDATLFLWIWHAAKVKWKSNPWKCVEGKMKVRHLAMKKILCTTFPPKFSFSWIAAFKEESKSSSFDYYAVKVCRIYRQTIT